MSIIIWIKYLIYRFTPHLFFDKILYKLSFVDNSLLKILDEGKNIYVFLGCDYTNLGDYAITIAQCEILHKLFPDYRVHMFYCNNTYKSLKTVVKYHHTDDLVTIIGGGNMSDLYYGYERKRNLIVEVLSEYRIISFPQSVVFTNTKYGRLAFERSMRTYQKHPNLLLLFREEKSYRLIKNAYPQLECYLTPDVVMTLNYKKNNKREGVVVSLRKDKESFLTEVQKNEIIKEIENTGAKYRKFDTYIKDVSNLNGDFETLIKMYQEAKMVVTDRLHGMIFSYITGTPAVVFPNNNGKIEYSYQWIRNCKYIHFLNSLESFSEILYKYKNLKENQNSDAEVNDMIAKFVFLREIVNLEE